MNEILVEEENTVYELDPECLRHKEEQRQLEEKRKQEKQENDNYRMQKLTETYFCHKKAILITN